VKNWKQNRVDDSKDLMLRFHRSPEFLWGNYIRASTKLDMKCDLSMKQCREIVSPITRTAGCKLDREWISESLASVNLVQFSNRLNYRVYKNAFKRFGKKLCMVCCIEGGRKDIRETANWDDDKRFHAHISIQRPNHINFESMVEIIKKEWLGTEWGYNQMVIEPYNPAKNYEEYQTKTGFDAIQLDSTNLCATALTNRTGISSKIVH